MIPTFTPTPTPTPAAPGPPAGTHASATQPTSQSPRLGTAPESETVLSLAGNKSTNSSGGAVVPSTGGQSSPQAAGSSTPTSPNFDAASNSADALGISDNLLLPAMVAVFALLVIVLVSAGGHRGSWREH